MSNAMAAAVWTIMFALCAAWIIIAQKGIFMQFGRRPDDEPATDSQQVGALIRAIMHTDTHDSRRPVDVAIDLLDALAVQGWRLIHG